MLGKRRNQRGAEVAGIGLRLPGGHHEGKRHQSEKPDAVFDYAESTQPEYQPDQQADWDDPPLQRDTSEQLEGDGGAADLGRQQQDVNEQFSRQRHDLEMHAKALADGRGQ